MRPGPRSTSSGRAATAIPTSTSRPCRSRGSPPRWRQIAVKNIGREESTLLITNDTATRARDLFARYAERMLVENELASYIAGFHVDSLASGLALNVDVDTTLTVIAGSLYRLLARSLKR